MRCNVCGNDYENVFQGLLTKDAIGRQVFCCPLCALEPAESKRTQDDLVTRASDDSFPASDPPAWNAGTDPHAGESGRVGYLVLYLLGAPIGVLLLLWVLLGNNLIGPG